MYSPSFKTLFSTYATQYILMPLCDTLSMPRKTFPLAHLARHRATPRSPPSQVKDMFTLGAARSIALNYSSPTQVDFLGFLEY